MQPSSPSCWTNIPFLNCLQVFRNDGKGKHNAETSNHFTILNACWSPCQALGHQCTGKAGLHTSRKTVLHTGFSCFPAHSSEVLICWFCELVFAFPMSPGTRFSICLQATAGVAVVTCVVLIKPSAGSTCHFTCHSTLWSHEITQSKQPQAWQQCPHVILGGGQATGEVPLPDETLSWCCERLWPLKIAVCFL